MPTIHTVDAFEVQGRTTVRTEDGTFLRLAEQRDGIAALGPALEARIRGELEDRRRVRTAPRAGRADVGILAPAAFIRELETRLPGSALRLRTVTPQAVTSGGHLPGILLHVAETPGERSLADRLPAAGTAVLRCYREGGLLFIDPLRLHDGDPDSRQVLRRRLAASSAPAELEAWLDRQQPGGFLDGLPAAAHTLFFARLLTVLTDWQHHTPALDEHRRTLWRLDTTTLVATGHPVLAYPEPAPHPGRRR
ncbi:hypothetical protein [Arthrobacter sp. Y-9]|uniref:hypothetical protein n=1 Tax=Arthrobacter sp. Y-9 TaxID=3039385 RepID=UPI00241F5CCE|nr:hypothetical protein [Arthrobacter sp. Y-9]WFR83872.1 hypothetical protein P9849_15115 [Arthrobacter sp. Y-9]